MYKAPIRIDYSLVLSSINPTVDFALKLREDNEPCIMMMRV